LQISKVYVHTQTLDLSWKLISLIYNIDRYDGAWQAIECMEGHTLKELNFIAAVRRVGIYPYLGSKLSVQEVYVLLKNMSISK